MPVAIVPFEWIGIDIVGSCHKYMLVVVDYYVTHYLEAVPVRNIRADTVAKKLALLFSWVGFPKQVVTDQGPPFMSKTLKAMWGFNCCEPQCTIRK